MLAKGDYKERFSHGNTKAPINNYKEIKRYFLYQRLNNGLEPRKRSIKS